jgi:hypothetical protein
VTEERTVKQWEYLWVTYGKGSSGYRLYFRDGKKFAYDDIQPVLEYIDQLGLSGWEMVSASSDAEATTMWFKRPI